MNHLRVWNMFGLVGYLMADFAVSCVLTVVIAMMRPIKQQDDWKAWKLIIGLMLGIGLIPYGYVEVVTAMHGNKLKQGVLNALSEAEIQGRLEYSKVIWANEKAAHVIAVGRDQNEFGMPERVIMEIDLKPGKQGWDADAYTIVSSFKRQRDATTMPPYW